MLEKIDRKIFDFINRDIANPFFDFFFPFWTDFQKNPLFYAMLVGLIIYSLWKKNYKVFSVLLFTGIGATLVDKLNSLILKPFFMRARPEDVILRTDFHGSFSFPSSHALLAFFIIGFIVLFYPRLKKILIPLAICTAFSRIYCGVHYPSDILVGALLGLAFAYLYKKLLMNIKFSSRLIPCFLLLTLTTDLYAKDLLPWLWEDQFKPTLTRSVDETGLIIMASGVATTLAAHGYDKNVYEHNEKERNQILSDDTASIAAQLGNGLLGVAIAGAQIVFDRENGFKTSQAIILTSLTHVSMAAAVQRERPGNKDDFLPFPSSFPSGHTSSAFALAGSMAYSYGAKVGIPAFAVASAIGLSRIEESRHWLSDVVAGAFIGTFWARAAFDTKEKDPSKFSILPMPIYDGALISAVKGF